MKASILSVLIIILSILKSFGQEKIWTKQSKISEVITFEKKINSKAEFLSQGVFLTKEYYPLASIHVVTDPVIIKRKPTAYLPVYTHYFYTPGDSVLRFVLYDWEKGLYENSLDEQKIWKEELDKLEAYKKEYVRIKRILLVEFGLAKSADESPKIIDSESGNYLDQTTLWENDNIHAELNLIFSETTHRVRLTLYWKN